MTHPDLKRSLNILIAGCGHLGHLLGEALAKQHTVWGLRRSQISQSSSIKWIQADLTNKDSLRHIPDNIDYIFFTAAPHIHTARAYLATYLIGLKNLLNTLKVKQIKLKRFYFVSSTSVYHQSHGEWVDENSTTLPIHFTGRVLLKAEWTLASFDIPYTIIRFSGIYGPKRLRLIRDLQQGKLTLTQLPIYTNRIHEVDCVRLLLFLMEQKNLNHLYIGTDEYPCEKNELLIWLAKELKITTLGKETLSNPHPMQNNKRCSSNKIKSLGFTFKYPTYREGYLDCLK